MSSFPRVLRGSAAVESSAPPVVGTASRVIRRPALGQNRTIAEPATFDAEEEAFNRGIEQGRSAAREQLMSASQALQSALEQGRAHLRDEFDRQRDEIVALAVDMVGLVTGHDHHDGGVALRARIDEALGLLDDEDLVIAMNEVDLPLAADIAGPGIRLVPDRALEPGEARIMGQWARADLTRAAAQAILKERLA